MLVVVAERVEVLRQVRLTETTFVPGGGLTLPDVSRSVRSRPWTTSTATAALTSSKAAMTAKRGKRRRIRSGRRRLVRSGSVAITAVASPVERPERAASAASASSRSTSSVCTSG